MKPKNVEDIFRLSPIQQGLLFHTLYAPEAGAYFDQYVMDVPRANRDILRSSWQTLIDRHPILRVSFMWDDLEEPVQIVHRQVELPFEMVDLSSLPESDQQRRVKEIARADRRRGFDLAKPPLVRLTWIELGERACVIWSYHHLLIDGWSSGHLIQELRELRLAHGAGRVARLERRRPYRDYIGWLARQDLAQAEAYWRRQLEGFDAPTPLGIDRTESRSRRGQPGEHKQLTRLIDIASTAALKDLARRQRVTQAVLFEASWALVLAHYSGQRDLVFGLTVSGRPAGLRGSQAMIGCFINTLPVRVRIGRDDRVGPWLQSLQAAQNDLRKFEHSPLVEVQKWSDVPGDDPLFESIVVYESFGFDDMQSAEEGFYQRTNYPLTLQATPLRTGLELFVGFDSARFDDGAMERLLAHQERVLLAMVEQPEGRLLDLALLGEPEQQQLRAWNDTDSPSPLPADLHPAITAERRPGEPPRVAVCELLRAWARKTPEAPAAKFDGRTWSYAELAERAAHVAAELRAGGVGPEMPVGLLAERSDAFLLVLLGILEAGGVYLPLDPQQPAPRLARVLGESRARRVVVAAPFAETLVAAVAGLPADERPEVIDLDQLLEARHEGSAEVESTADPEHLAYVIYTSGSTGTPKGAMLEHRGMVNHLEAKIRDLDLDHTSVVAQTASQMFDISVWQFLVPLVIGGRVEIYADDVAHDPVALIEAIAADGVTVLETVPSLLRFLLDELEEQGEERPALDRLAWLMPTGEALPSDQCRRWLALYPDAALVNAYGPTECSDDVSHHILRQVEPADGVRVSIGRPVGNLKLWVADPGYRLCAIGVGGELMVGGVGVGRGYLNDPRRTADVFVPDPYCGQSGARLYRTGDLARWRADGNLEYLGRTDHQVKVRGVRIELGEIEAVLAQHEGLSQVAVLVLKDPSGQPALVAYTLAHGPETGRGAPSASELREFVRSRLPEPMVPAAFVAVDEMPLTRNGKLDRKALPAPEWVGGTTGLRARNPTEELLTEVWGEVLGVEIEGVESNFFELGGHSLLITRVASRIRKLFGVELQLRELFEEPTIAAQARRIEAVLSGAAGHLSQIEVIDRQGELPLSFAQERLWFLDQLHGTSGNYNIPAAVRLRGTLSVAALGAGFSTIVRRHEALRSRYVNQGGRPRLVIEPPSPQALPLIDLAALDEARRDRSVRQLVAAEAVRPFDLASGPLLRTTLLRLAADDHVLLYTMHHIVSDAGSTAVLQAELMAFYQATVEGETVALSPLPVQYVDYAAWQRERLSAGRLEEQLAAWRERLAGAPARLQLPTDRPYPAVQSVRGGGVPVHWPLELREQLRALGRKHGATLYMTLLAAYQTLLWRLSGESDVLVGTSVANRDRIETEGLIGIFLNTLVMRGDLEQGKTFAELLEATREYTLWAYAHQDVPFERLVDELAPQRSLAHSPLFQVMLDLQNAPAEAGQANAAGDAGEAASQSLRLEQVGGEQVTAKFDLILSVVEQPDHLTGYWEYCRDLFDESTIVRWNRHLVTLLEAVVEGSEEPLSRLPLQSPAEDRQVLAAWADSRAEPVARQTLVELFEAQVDRDPTAVAVVHRPAAGGAVELTYGELEERANRLAHRLRRQAIGPESLVGLAMDRTAELVVAILGILKAGGAYLPLDPAYPEARLSWMAEDAGVRVVIADAGSAIDFSQLSCVVLGVEAEEESSARLAPVADLDHVAYVIYTSGSTGRPKGVPISHRQVSRLLSTTEGDFDFGADDVWTLFHSYAFDFSVWELWGALAYGGRLVVVPREISRSPEEFLDLLRREQVTVLNQTPSAFRQLVAADRRAAGGELALRWVIFGGEALELTSLEPWFERHGDQRPALVNMYGITETTVHVTRQPVYGHHLRGVQRSPVGPPLPDLELYLLDPHGRPVPFGVPAEIFVGGAGVGRGYLRRPALTAERFVPDGFGGRSGARLYRSGDQARLRPDGGLDFLGRIDQQVKIRGFRIELGEIEALLAAQPTVSEAIVVADDDPLAGPRLIGYLVPAVSAVDLAELRQALAAGLPDYMVPAALVAIDKVPLTANGKLDRKALPAPSAARPELEAQFEEPASAAEHQLAEIWRQVLGVERIGRNDSFFELGGHSLLGTQVVSRVASELGVQLPLGDVFDRPRLADLAEVLEQLGTGASGAAGEATAAGLPAIVPVDRSRPLPLSYAQERMWFLDQLEGGSAKYNIASAARIGGELDLAVLGASLSEIVRRHEVLRTVFTAVDGRPGQVVLEPRPVALPVVDLRRLTAAERQAEASRRVAAEVMVPFDLSRGPLLRFTLLRLAEAEHVVLFTLHHTVSDGWSGEILIGELGVLYETFAAGRPSPLPELEVQYADFAVWQRQWLASGELERQLEVWRQRLAGAPTSLALPTDRPYGVQRDSRAGSLRQALGQSLDQRLKALARDQGLSPFMILLATYQVLLARLSGQHDLLVGSPIANRNRVETEGLVGFFANTLALRGDLRGNPTVGELLQRTRETLLEAYAHQDLPFEILVDDLQPERNLDNTPLFQVMLALQVIDDEGQPAGSALAVEPVDEAPGITKFDLTLSLVSAPDGLGGVWLYRRELFDESTIRRFAASFETLLTALVDGGLEQRFADLPLVAPPQLQRLLVDWNAPDPDYSDAGLLAELVAAQVERHGDEPAVIFDGEVITYSELDQRSNRLAHHLLGLGVGPETLVGVHLERSFALVETFLALVKIGGVYLPLAPEQPDDRLAFMVADAGASLVVTTTELAQRLPTSPEHLLLDRAAAAIAAQPAERPAVRPWPDSSAYVIYTSGSTGRPKGVVVPHRALANRMRWVSEVDLQPGVRFLQKTTMGFDVSVAEIFAPLASGGATVLARPGGEKDTSYLVDLIVEQGITHTSFPPTLLQVLLDDPRFTGYRGLSNVITGGETVPAELPEKFYARIPGADLENRYGPTEATISVTRWICRREGRERVLPIGRPIGKSEIYLVDRGLQPLPVGVPGELLIGGVSLARGYLARPALTAEVFVPDPFSGRSGDRLYRSGDLARYRPDGAIEFVGRIDHQVKIRGFRVELGEIEAALRQQGELREVAVVDLEPPGGGSRRLAAFLVAETPGERPDDDQLRAFLRRTLPEYMVPAAFTYLDELPLSATGKVDRKALPEPQWGRETDGEAFVAPRDETENALAAIWSEVLGVEQVGIHDNFFALGGDSILSLQIVSRANRAGLGLTPRLVFEHQTVAELASVVGEVRQIEAEQGLVTGEAPLTPVQRWFFDQDFADAQHWNQSVVLAIGSEVPAAAVEQALAAVVRQHDVFRLRYRREGAEDWRQWHTEETTVPCERIDLAALEPEPQLAAIEARGTELQGALDLAECTFRAALFELGAGRGSRLLLIAHHLLVDGVSWRIVVEDLEAALRQLLADPSLDPSSLELGQKTTSFQQWSERLSDYVASGKVDAELPYWRELAADPPAPLPVDDAQGANTVGDVVQVATALDEATTQGLLRESAAAYRTEVTDLLLAALLRSVADWSGRRSLLLTVEGHGREEIFDDLDISRTAGWFTTLSPLRLRLPDGGGASALIKAVKEQRRASPRHGMGYGLLRYLSPSPEIRQELAAVPQADVALNYLGQIDAQTSGEDRLVAFSGEQAGPEQSPRSRRVHRLVVSGLVVGGRLQLSLAYGAGLYQRATIEELADRLRRALEDLVAHCRAPQSFGYTPSDFPLAEIDQPTLDRLLGATPDVEALYPLSPMQEGMFFHSLYAPSSGFYFMQRSVELLGEIDVEALEGAWNLMLERHSVLRSSLLWKDLPRPLQVVHRHVRVGLERHDWRQLDPAEADRRLAAFMAEERAAGFDFTQAPLLRLYWFDFPGGGQRLTWSFHHVLMDGWSGPLLLGEVFAAYESLRQGAQPNFPPTRRYEDYIAWLESKDMAETEAYWRRYLAGFERATPLTMRSVEVAETDSRSTDYRRHGQRLAESLSDQLEALAKRHRVTVNTLIQAAWGLLLSRYSGERDVVFGVTVSGRPPELAGAENIVGLFINTLPLRLDASPDQQVGEWLEALQAQQVETRSHEFSPLIDIQGWSDVRRGEKLFESILVFENYPIESAVEEGGGVSFELGQVETFERTNYPLHVMADPDPLSLEIGYDRAGFEPEVIERLVRQMVRLLEGMAENSSRSLGELSMTSGAEGRELVVDWNQTAKDYPRDVTAVQLFEARVAEDPDALALVAEGLGADGESERQELTYGELNRRVNLLAHSLRDFGVERETLVGLYAQRSAEMVIGALAIWKAGGAYLPLDPAYPAERLTAMLEDAGCFVLVGHRDLVDELPHAAPLVLYLDDEPFSPEEDNLEPIAVPGNRAYVIYTSGSTGKPKGVEVSHQGLVNYLSWAADAYRVAEGGGSVVHSSLAFDLTVTGLWVPLVAGRPVRLLAEGAGVEALGKALANAEDLSLVKLTPAHLELLGQQLRPEQAAGRAQALVIGGEALPPETLRFWRQHAPATRLINEYGPTETVVGCSIYEVPVAGDLGRSIPIGRPIANSRLYVIDGTGAPQPKGIAGELLIGGDGVARGYLGRPALTAERFVPDPFAEEAGGRLYRTGDLARHGAAGELEFLGRRDHQVKVRGFRIELGEIEAALTEHQAVREAVVIVREDVAGDRRLVAYQVVDGEAATDEELREHLGRTLPEYMVPAVYVTLEALPLTENGKVDRRALPVPGGLDRAAESSYVAPRTTTEEVMAGIWADVLGHQRVGIHDNFFDLGGHSLLATQVIGRLRDALQVELDLDEIFETPTIAELAQLAEAGGTSPSAPPLVPTDRSGPLPLSFAQQRLWFLDQLEPGSAAYNIPSALRLRGALQPAALSATFDEIVRRHEILRTTFEWCDGQPCQRIGEPPSEILQQIDLSAGPEAEREQRLQDWLTAEAAAPFDLQAGPLLRATLLRLGDEDHVLAVTQHHIVSDGWSEAVLVRELETLYAAFVEGSPAPLGELPIQYGDYAVWQNEWLRGEVLEEQLEYWRRQLADIPSRLDLPTDRPRPAVATSRGASVSRLLPTSLLAALHDLSRRTGGTLFMTLLGTLDALLLRLTGEHRLVVGTPVANRQRTELEPLIGLFLNTLAVRVDAAGDPTFRDLLGRVRSSTLGAFSHQDLPFERLVEDIQPRRDLSQTPIFQVMLVLQSASPGSLELPGLEIGAALSGGEIAKFDLGLTAQESADGLRLSLSYKTDLFERDTVERLLKRLEVLLASVAEDPDQRLSELPLLAAEERQLLVAGAEGERRDYAPDVCLHELFEARVDAAGERLAVSFDDGGTPRTMTYGELERRANRLAHGLRRRGAGPETRIGICAERSLDLVVALYGVLKAGAAYLPIDPDYPADRLAFMVEDAAVSWLLTQDDLRHRLPPTGAEILPLDGSWTAGESDQRPAPLATPENLAYVIYTSGSTGRPKGAMNSHRGIVNRLAWMQEQYGLTAEDRILQKTPFSFDVSVWEFFWPLLEGAAMVLARPGGHQDPAYLRRLIVDQGVTTIHFVPSMLQVFLAEPEIEACSSLRQVLASGEALPAELVSRYYERLSAPLDNLYGPTEAAVDVTWWSCRKDQPRRSIPIGRPIANTRVRVLDRHLRLVPLGVPGELCLGGVQLARGYWRRTGLTAERFVPDPLAESAGERLYRTGDLCRQLADGTVEFLGRLDHQVKLRGLRIELGEIEANLLEHPMIDEAVVVAHQDAGGDGRLHAYIAGDGSAPPTFEELGTFLAERLPDYMVPSTVTALEALPLNANGKVDRRALPEPVDLQAAKATALAPRTPVELELVALFEEVLDRRGVGVRDSFFDLGGHSLLAARLLAEARSRLGIDCSMLAFFQGPTVEQMATAPRRSSIAGSPLVPIRSAGERRPIFAVHPVLGDAVCYSGLARSLDDEQPFYGLQSPALAGTGPAVDDVGQMARQYLEEVRRVQPQGPYRLLGWSFGGLVAYEMACQLEAAGEKVELLALLDTFADEPTADTAAPDDATQILEFLAEWQGFDADEIRHRLDGYGPDQRLEGLVRELVSRGYLAPDTTVEVLDRYLQVQRAHERATAGYEPAPWGGRLVLFRATERAGDEPDATLGWGELAKQGVEVHHVVGNHQQMVFPPQVEQVAAGLRAYLETTEAAHAEID